MIVAVQKGMETTMQQLRKRGYDVVTFGEYNYPIDSIVYSGQGLESSYIKSNNIPNLTAEMSIEGHGKRTQADRSYGVLMVSAQHKSIDEIDQILKNKVYSPLF